MNKIGRDKVEEIKNYLAILLVLLIVVFFVFPASTLNPEANQLRLEKITMGTLDKETDLRINRIVEKYDDTGKLSYRVSFVTSYLGYKIECDIPESLIDKLDKSAIYTGTISIVYAKELYESILEMSDSYNSIDDVLTLDSSARGLYNIKFMFSEYITNGVTDKELIEEDIILKYGKQNAEENSSDGSKEL